MTEVDAAAPVAPFVQQLYKLVHEGLHVTWAADGAALVIPDTQRFAADRCPVYFKHSNWTSFARMLNMYEFRRRKSADGSAIFAHPHFTRDGARLARVVRKKRASTTSSWEEIDAEGKSLAAEDVARAAASGVDWRHRCRELRRRVDQLEAENARLRDEPAAVPRPREPSDRTTFCDDLFSPKRRRSGGCL